MTRSVGIGGTAGLAASSATASFAGSTVPTICTRRPIHAVMSTPLRRYPSSVDAELPTGAVPAIVPLVPTAPGMADVRDGGSGWAGDFGCVGAADT